MKEKDIFEMYSTYCKTFVPEDKRKYLIDMVAKSLIRSLFEKHPKKLDGRCTFLTEKGSIEKILTKNLQISNDQIEQYKLMFEKQSTVTVSNDDIEDISNKNDIIKAMTLQLSEKDKLIQQLRDELESLKKSKSKKQDNAIITENKYQF